MKAARSGRQRRPSQSRKELIDSMFQSGFRWSKKLSAHTSCVNALAFSSKGGRFLASGGDDLTVHLWDFHQERMDEPTFSFAGPRRNIFTLGFSANNRYLFSGGTDDIVQQFDLQHLESPSASTSRIQGSERMFYEESTIRCISCHPFRDEIFMSANEAGLITLYDTRAPTKTTPRGYGRRHGTTSSSSQQELNLNTEVTGVQFHPTMEHVFVSSAATGGVHLRDSRMAFGSPRDEKQKGVTQSYNTRICKSRMFARPEVSSVTFDGDGSRLAVTFLHYLPTIYSLSDPNPIAVCSGKTLPGGGPIPEGDRSYSNCCTMKHGSFGGAGLDTDGYYCAGSDDFRGYLWKLPETSQLLERRQVIPAKSWDISADTTGFVQDALGPRYVPVDLSTPVYRLTGHKSIVNTTMIHPSLPHIVTSGVERHVILHSPTSSSQCASDLELTSQRTRRLQMYDTMDSDEEEQDGLLLDLAILRDDPDASESNDVEASERTTVALFDRILRVEGEASPFGRGSWDGMADCSDSSDSSDGDSDVGMD